jgi:uncharacterized membrane protein
MEQIEESVKAFTLLLGTAIEGFASLIVAQAVVIAAGSYFKNPFHSNVDKMELRLKFGKSLAVALEFLLAADILRTAVAPSWDDIGKLAAIAALRTLLNFFLEKELKAAEL